MADDAKRNALLMMIHADNGPKVKFVGNDGAVAQDNMTVLSKMLTDWDVLQVEQIASGPSLNAVLFIFGERKPAQAGGAA